MESDNICIGLEELAVILILIKTKFYNCFTKTNCVKSTRLVAILWHTISLQFFL